MSNHLTDFLEARNVPECLWGSMIYIACEMAVGEDDSAEVYLECLLKGSLAKPIAALRAVEQLRKLQGEFGGSVYSDAVDTILEEVK